MINKDFEVYKLKRELRRSGKEYEILRYGKNEFDEPNDKLESVGKIEGLYFETNGSISVMVSDTTRFRTKKIPMILCLYEDVKRLNLEVDDFLKINEKTMKVTGVINIQEWNLIGEISLEVIDNGTCT